MDHKDPSHPLSAGSYVSILDSDHIELFNRSSLSDPNTGWLWFMEQKKLAHYRTRRRWSNGLTLLFGVFFLFALLFLLLAARSSGPDDFVPGNQQLFDNSANDGAQSGLSEESLHHSEQCLIVAPNERVDCNPDPPISRDVCQSRGCCWMALDDAQPSFNSTSRALPPLGVPYCFFGTDYRGYNVSEMHDSTSTFDRKVAILQRLRPSGFHRDVQRVKLAIDELSSTVLRIKLTDSASARYEVPIPKLSLPKDDHLSLAKLYRVELNEDTSTLIVYRIKTDTALFQVDLRQLVYSDQFLQITSKLPAEFIYGIGENREPFRKSTQWKRYTLFARDQWPVPDKALYGSHPFYLTTEPADNSTHGLFLFNSNAMDILTQPAPAITYRTIGGVLDFFLFLGPTAEEVVAQYQSLIGLPALPPYWSLGFHLSRFGYQNLTNLEQTYRRTKQAKIPFDVQWTDIDMFQGNNDFTYDHTRFAGFPEFIAQLHAEGMRFVPMFDCGISAGESPPNSYAPYAEGLEMGVFVRNSTNQPFIGKVWNSKSTVWPDFTHPNATRYWTRQFAAYHRLIEYDGAWTDMNEPSNFLNGQANGCPTDSSLESPQYTPGMTEERLTLRYKTLCMTARQTAGLHYNVHNLYGLSEAIVTNSALKSVLNRRPFILSRSTAPGHGHFAAHWDGDIISDWPSMKWSISSILNFNMFGVPLVGADICGFNGNTSAELCARWHQLGAFYSFSRNHNTDDALDQDPVALGATVVGATREALTFRYAHLPYLYTLLYKVHRSGGTVLRPLFFEFPNDPTVGALDEQFLWGSSLMIAPTLRQGEQESSVYFPAGTWFHATNYSRVDSSGESMRQEARFDAVNVYYRAGAILPLQKPNLTTDATRAGNFSLYIVLDDSNGTAKGSLYWDAGDGLDTEELGHYNLYNFNVDNRILDISSSHLGYRTAQTFNDLLFFGFKALPSEIFLDGIPVNWAFSQRSRTLHVRNLALPLYNGQKAVQYRIEWKM